MIHIEAESWSFDKRIPDDINRMLTDHISEVFFCPIETAEINLKNGGSTRNVFHVGDMMVDTILFIRDVPKNIQKFWKLCMCQENSMLLQQFTAHPAQTLKKI